MDLNKQPNAKRGLICGIWYLNSHADSKGYLLLEREPVYLMPEYLTAASGLRGWGQSFEFRENGDLVDAYADECGSASVYHNWSGKWFWNEEEQSIFLRIENYPALSDQHVKPSEAYKTGAEFYITELSTQRMQLRPNNPDVQLWV